MYKFNWNHDHTRFGCPSGSNVPGGLLVSREQNKNQTFYQNHIRSLGYSSRGNLTVRWIASPIKKDIAGFYVLIRNVHNRILTEYHLPYDKRITNIIGDEICDGNCNNLELCALSKDSNGTINGWFDSQCIFLPNDFERIRNKYNDRSSQIFVIHSIRKQIRAKSVANRDSRSSGAIKAIVGNIVIQCVFVTMFVLYWMGNSELIS